MRAHPQRRFDIPHADYPFRENWMEFQDSYIHYLDEGHGPTVLLLHGNPTWSYLYRKIVLALKNECRLIAPDYPGFGHSGVPSNYGFTPAEQSEAISRLIETLRLKDIILVVQDWGGPIGMRYAIDHPENIRGLVIMNSWAWEASLPQQIFSLAMGGWPLGYWLQTRLNFFVNKILPSGIYHRELITKSLREAYTKPFQTTGSRLPTWVFPRHIRHSYRWLKKLESRLSALVNVPTQIVWGARDEPGFRPEELKRWQSNFPFHETEILEDASHYVQEDRPDRVTEAIRRIIVRTEGLT